MPKLPDYTALGAPSGPQPSGQIAHYSPQGFSAGQEAWGEVLGGRRGLGAQFSTIGADQEKKADALQNAQADAELSIGRTEAITEAHSAPYHAHRSLRPPYCPRRPANGGSRGRVGRHEGERAKEERLSEGAVGLLRRRAPRRFAGW